MTPTDTDTLVHFLKVLADPSRLRILGLLAQAEHGVDELASLLALKAPTVSHHLKRLRELDLVTMRPEGTQRFYRLNEATLQGLARTLLAPEALTRATGEIPYAERVLGNYLVDGRLKEIPAQRKKRAVVLEHLARQIDRGREYSEKEISALLGAFHPDFATLRRELVMARLVEREDGVYRRTDRDEAYDPQAR